MHLQPLASLTHLKQLHAGWLQDNECRGSLTDAGTEGIGQLLGLEELDLCGSALGDVTLHRLARLTQLRRLRLAGSDTITDAGLKVLGDLQALEEVELGHCPLVTNEGLAHLGRLIHLKVLRVGGPGLDDTGVVHLCDLKDLEYLQLYGTQVTVGAAERLLVDLPGVAIGVADTLVKRTPEVVRFHRQDINARASLAVPEAWDTGRWQTYGSGKDECFQGELREPGYRHQLSYSVEAGPGDIAIYCRPAEKEKSAADLVNDRVDHDDGYQQSEPDTHVRSLPDTDVASRRYVTSFGSKLLCVWIRNGTHYEITCAAPKSRWQLLEPIFTQMLLSFWFTEDGPAPDVGPAMIKNPAVPRRQPSPEEEERWHVIAATPRELGPRLRYADWLDTQNDPLGEFIRVQIERDRSTGPDQRKGLQARERVLLESYQREWVRPLQLLGLTEPIFHGGLVESGSVPASAFVKHAAELFVAAPALCRLRFQGVGVALQNLVRCEHLTRLTELDLRNTGVTGEQLGKLLASPHLAGLRVLDACANQLGPDAATGVAQAAHLRDLTKLDMCCNQVGDDGLEILAIAPHLASLTSLDLAGNGVTERGVHALSASPNLTRLTYLNLGGPQFGPLALKLLAAALNFAGLRELYLHGCPVEEGEIPVVRAF